MKELIKYSATWCNPCKVLSRTLTKIDLESTNTFLSEIDVDEFKSMCKIMNVRSVPTLILMKDGVELRRLTGVQTLEKLTLFLED
jgi:thioredoxin 1